MYPVDVKHGTGMRNVHILSQKLSNSTKSQHTNYLNMLLIWTNEISELELCFFFLIPIIS